MKDYDPLTPEEVNNAAKEFFPLFDIVHRNMPENCTVEDTIKVMETVCSMAQKRRAYDQGNVGPFGFNKERRKRRSSSINIHILYTSMLWRTKKQRRNLSREQRNIQTGTLLKM